MTKKQQKQQHDAMTKIASRLLSETGAQISIMDIGKIYDAGRTAISSGTDLETAIAITIAQLRTN